MSTYSMSIICEKCGFQDALLTGNYKSGEESVLCERCGWDAWTEIVVDSDNCFVEDDEGHWQYRTYETYARFIYCLAQGFMRQIGTIHHELSAEEIENLRQQFESQPDPAECWLLKRDDQAGRMVAIVGCPPWALAPDHPLATLQNKRED